MSIDARIVGLQVTGIDGVSAQQVKLILEDRPGGGPAGQPAILVDGVPNDWKSTPIEDLVGCDIWGGSSQIMLGEKELAVRIGYQGMVLVDGWQDVIRDYRAEM